MPYLPVSEVGAIITPSLREVIEFTWGEVKLWESDWWCCDPTPELWSLITLCWVWSRWQTKTQEHKSHIFQGTPRDIQLYPETSLVVIYAVQTADASSVPEEPNSFHLMTQFSHTWVKLASQMVETSVTFPLYFSQPYSTLLSGFEILKGIFFF